MSGKVEILAPAGDIQCLKAALLAGADAVYLGGKQFGARAFAQNFGEAALKWARRATHSLGRKMYITVNTLVFDREFPLLGKYFDFLESLRPDALIIQDLGVAAILAERKSAIPRHLSTQAAWSGIGGTEELAALGFSRIILPREMTLEEIRNLAKKAPFELEVFVHGAMCYSISGRCFWSVALGDRSGNRGTCAQPCRKAYRLSDREGNAFFFSPRDLSLGDRLHDLREAGVKAFKIEGRMKGPEFVHTVVKAYRGILDGESPRNHERALREVYTRPFHQGFLPGVPKENWSTGTNPGREGQPVGTVLKHRPDGLVELRTEIPVAEGDGLYAGADGTRTGCRITYVQTVPDRPGTALVRGLDDRFPPGTQLFRSSSSGSDRFLKDWNRDWERFPVELFWSGFEGSPLAVEARFFDLPLRVESEEKLVLAIETGLEQGILQEKFACLGENFRAVRHVTKALGERLFLSPGGLKRLKRSLVDALTAIENAPPPLLARDGNRASAWKGPASELHFPGKPPEGASKSRRDSSSAVERTHLRVHLRVWNQQFRFARDLQPDSWIVPFKMDHFPDRIDPLRTRFWLPAPKSEKELLSWAEILSRLPPQEFLCLGWEAFRLAKLLPKHTFRVDWSFNVSNQRAIDFVGSRGVRVTLAREWPSKALPPWDDEFVWSLAWNPLISFSRFPPLVPSGKTVSNSHNDRFFLLDLGNGVSGLFLSEKPAVDQIPPVSEIQIDLAISPTDSSYKTALELEKLITSLKQRPLVSRRLPKP